MSISLADALEEVELEPGHTYECDVRGQHVVVRVLSERPSTSQPATPPDEASALDPNDIRLDAWRELPAPRSLGTVPSRLVDHIPFDIPEMPHDEDDQ
jgi:hypothetical protein